MPPPLRATKQYKICGAPDPRAAGRAVSNIDVPGMQRAALACLAGGAYAVAVMLEIHDPYIGPAIHTETGLGYLLIAYGFSIVAVIAPIFAAMLERRKATSAH
jgi:hypothetical protein